MIGFLKLKFLESRLPLSLLFRGVFRAKLNFNKCQHFREVYPFVKYYLQNFI